MKRAGWAIAAAAALTIGAAEAAAQKIERPTVFVGGSAGISAGAQRADYVESAGRDETVETDGFVSALGVFAGVEHKGLAAELGYLKLGDQDIEITPNAAGSEPEAVVVARDVMFVTMSHELPWKSTKGIKITTHVKVGLAKWGSESTIGDLSGVDLVTGLNVTLKVAKNIDLRADALLLPASDQGQSDHQAIFLLGLAYGFEF